MATPVTLVEVPTIEGMLPGLFAGKIDSGMRKGIPMEDWASVITLYNSEAARVVQFTGNESPRNARVLLLNGNGRVVWYHDRGFSPGVLNDLHRIVVDSNTNKSKSTTDAVSLRVLFNFESKSAFEGWRTINDSVMGGISDSTFEQYDSNSALFTGEVSLENNGGFASVRSGNQVFNLGDVRGLEVEIIGDGKLYQCNMRMDGAFDGIGYQTTFPTQAGKRETIRLAFEAFQPTFRGRLQPNAPTLDPEKIVNVGFLVGSKQQGPFRLQIFRVSALD
ncbi:MAG: CIA30 family protein [Planctomycetota bacterium]